MLTDKLDREGYGVIYIQPVFVLLNTILRKNVNSVPISPRKIRVSQIDKRSYIQKIFIGLSGYFYALAAYAFIRLYLGRNKIVVCDRYFYQFFFDLFGDLSEQIARFFPKPDIAFLLDGDLDVFYSRMISSFDASVGKDYYERVINLFNKLSKDLNFVKIDTTLDKKVVNDLILKHLLNHLEDVCHE